MIWLFFLEGGVGLHGSSRSSFWLSLPVDGRSASRMFSKHDVGRLISARRKLTSAEQGDLECSVDLRSFGVVAVLLFSVLLFGFSLVIQVRVIMPIVEDSWGVGLTLMREQRSTMMRNEIIGILPTARSLVCLRRSLPIVGVPAHPCRVDRVIVVCMCSIVLI
jgi:hypothetical protein